MLGVKDAFFATSALEDDGQSRVQSFDFTMIQWESMKRVIRMIFDLNPTKTLLGTYPALADVVQSSYSRGMSMPKISDLCHTNRSVMVMLAPGLGKTLVGLFSICYCIRVGRMSFTDANPFSNKKYLIIAAKAIGGVQMKECDDYLYGSLCVERLEGTGKEKADRFGQFCQSINEGEEVMVMSTDDMKQAEIKTILLQMRTDSTFGGYIFDEFHEQSHNNKQITNIHTSPTEQMIYYMIHGPKDEIGKSIPVTIALTGTPIPNNLFELLSQHYLLFPGRFGLPDDHINRAVVALVKAANAQLIDVLDVDYEHPNVNVLCALREHFIRDVGIRVSENNEVPSSYHIVLSHSMTPSQERRYLKEMVLQNLRLKHIAEICGNDTLWPRMLANELLNKCARDFSTFGKEGNDNHKDSDTDSSDNEDEAGEITHKKVTIDDERNILDVCKGIDQKDPVDGTNTANDIAGDNSKLLILLAIMRVVLKYPLERVFIVSDSLELLKRADVMLKVEGIDGLYVDGNTTQDNFDEAIKQFQDISSGMKYIAGSKKKCQTGLTLTAGRILCNLDVDVTPAVDEQVGARMARKGQTKPVLYFQMITAHAIETSVFNKAATKAEMSKILLGDYSRLDELSESISPLASAHASATTSSFSSSSSGRLKSTTVQRISQHDMSWLSGKPSGKRWINDRAPTQPLVGMVQMRSPQELALDINDDNYDQTSELVSNIFASVARMTSFWVRPEAYRPPTSSLSPPPPSLLTSSSSMSHTSSPSRFSLTYPHALRDWNNNANVPLPPVRTTKIPKPHGQEN